MPSVFGNSYAPPGVFTKTQFESPVQGLLTGLKLPVFIGTGSETLVQTDLEMIRGSSATVDQKIIQEDETGRAVASISQAGAVTLGAFNGTLTRIQTKKYPIVNGDGTGTTATKSSSVSVTVNGDPIVVIAMSAATGLLTLATAPNLGDDVRVTYMFKRTDTQITNTVSDQVTTTNASIYGGIGESYTVSTGVNDTLVFTVDDSVSVTVTIPDSGNSTWTASQMAAFINGAAGSTSLAATTAVNNYGDTVVLISADRNISVGSGTANSTLGFTSGDSTGRNKVFYVFHGPIVDGSNGGVTTTDPSDVTVKVSNIQVIPTAVDGASRAVTLPFAPEAGAVVTIQYYFNAWQDTFDYLAHINVTDITKSGVSPGRSDYTDGVDFVLQDDRIVWGTAFAVSAGKHTVGSTYFNDSQVSGTLVDTRMYLQPCSVVVDSSVSPPVESRTQFALSLVPTTGNGRNSPLGSSLFQTASNDRIDLPTNRPDLVLAYWGFGVQDAIERGAVKVVKVDSATSTITLQSPVPVGASVYATFYYNTLVDQKYTLTVGTAGGSGTGTYSLSNEAGDSVITPKFGTKSSGLSTITLQFPSGSERKPDCRFETPIATTNYDGPVEEDVTVTFAAVDGTLAEYTTKGAGDYSFVLNASDRFRLKVDGSDLASGASGLDLGSVNGVANLGFVATMVGTEVAYDPATGDSTYAVDTTNDGVNLMVDGVLISATAAAGNQTVAAYVDAVNTAATATPPEYVAAGRMLSSTTITINTYDQLRFHYSGGVSGLSGNMVATIAPAIYASVSTLAAAVQSAMATALSGLGTAFTGVEVDVVGDGDGHLVFALTRATGYAARGTITCVAVLATHTVTIDGTVFTAISGARTPGSNDFNRSGSDIAEATDLVAAINDPLNWVGDAPVTASNGGTNVVTLVAVTVGVAGNSLSLTSTGGTMALSGADLAGGHDPDDSAYLDFITHGTPARDFAVLTGIDTAAATAGAQTKLVDGPIARRYTISGDNTGGLLHDRIILRSRLVPGQGTVHPAYQLSYAGIDVQGSTGDTNTGLVARNTALAGWQACILPATLLANVGFAGGQVAAGAYGDARDGQPLVTFYASGGTTDQNNILKFSLDGVPVTVTFTDAAGATIASAASADVPLGPASSANTVLGQIRTAVTAAGLSSASSRVLQEGAAIRLVSLLSTTVSNIVVGNGNANTILGFNEGDTAERDLVSAKTLASALMAHSAAAVADVLNDWDAPTASYFAAEALAAVIMDSANAEYLYLESQGNAGLGTASSLAFATASSDSVLLPGTGLQVVSGDGSSGEAGISGFYVTSSDPNNGSGTVNTSLLNTAIGQDGIIGQTYVDLVTGLTLTVLPRSGNASYPNGEFFTIKARKVVTTDSNLPTNAIPGLELIVSNTLGTNTGDTATAETFERGGEEPAIGDVYYVSYEYTKEDFDTALFTKFSAIEARYGSLSPDNPVTLAAYLAILNGAVLVGIKQVQKDTDTNSDGVFDTASITQFRDAVDGLEGVMTGGILPDILIPLRGDSTEFFQYITKHADIQSDIRHQAERTIIAGVASGTTPRSVGSVAQAVARTRFRLVYPDIVIVLLPKAEGPDEEALVDGTYLAAMLAGSVVSPNVDVATPWTNRRLVGASRLARTLDAVEQNQVAVKGVTVIEDRPPLLRVRHGLTTDLVGNSTNGNSTLSKLPTIIQIADEVQQQSRKTLDRFIGTKFLPGVLSQIEGQLSNTLKLLTEAQIIVAFTGIKANVDSLDSTAAEVQAYYSPVFPLLYIVASFSMRSSIT